MNHRLVIGHAPLVKLYYYAALALGASTVSAFSLKHATANSRKTEQHSLQAAPQAEREQQPQTAAEYTQRVPFP